MTDIFANRRQALKVTLGSFALSVMGSAHAQAKPLKILVPFAPGGGNDVFARQMAKSLGELRPQGVIVENKPGAGGNVGTEQVVRSPADGSTGRSRRNAPVAVINQRTAPGHCG